MHNVFDPESPALGSVAFQDFLLLDVRVGTILAVDPFPEARNPAYKLQIDFGSGVGVRKSSAQLTELYTPDDLLGRQITAVVNFPPRQIGKYMSEVLVLGWPDEAGRIVLNIPDSKVPNGARLV